jgi:hypothetical protein
MKTSFVLSALLCSAYVVLTPRSASAQIPNSSFENWTSFGLYEDPDGWVSFNGLTAPNGVLVCTMGTPGHSGASFMQLTTHNVPGLTIFPGVATTADLITGIEGFPCTDRPEALTGWWKYQGAIADLGLVTVIFTKWNNVTQQREEIGGGFLNTTGNMTAWTAFSTPITYISPDDPDTASISFSSSGGGIPQEGSTLSVDDLAFDDATIVRASPSMSPWQIFPSPAADVLTLRYGGTLNDLRMTTIEGRSTGPIHWLSSESIDVSDLSPGTYLLHAQEGSGAQHVLRFVKR